MRLDKTISKFSVADSLDLSLILVSLPTWTKTRQSCLVSVGSVKWALVAMTGAKASVHVPYAKLNGSVFSLL